VAYSLDLLHAGGSFFECPRWHDGTWYVSDFYGHQVLRITPAGVVTEIAYVPGQPAGLGFMPDGSLLIVSMIDRKVLRLRGDELVLHADLSGVAPGNLNEMVVDSVGRAYVGHEGEGKLGFARPGWPPTFLVRVAPDGSFDLEAKGLVAPNGAVITEDGSTLIVGETTQNRYRAYTIRPDGALAEPRVWAHNEENPFSPDGCCLDAEGAIWTAAVHQGKFMRVREGGAVLEEIVLPEGRRAIACMLGGEDGRTLALVTLDAGEGHPAGRLDSAIYTTTVEVPHGGRP
jgi:sugar lactone lactonase YvrE